LAGFTHPTPGLEYGLGKAYDLAMAEDTSETDVPAGWLEVLAESEADLAAGRTVPAEIVRRHLLESLARLEAKRASATNQALARRR
jgi:hypothetical protein